MSAWQYVAWFVGSALFGLGLGYFVCGPLVFGRR